MAIIDGKNGRMTLDMSAPLTVAEIQKRIRSVALVARSSLYIPEFTYRDRRIDAVIVDLKKRWVRGFEVKLQRSDFLKDDKWQLYSEFCSSLTMVCPSGLIEPEEIASPFGLVWIRRTSNVNGAWLDWRWMKKPKRFNHRDGLAWLYAYTRVLELEIPRLQGELDKANKLLGRIPSDSET